MSYVTFEYNAAKQEATRKIRLSLVLVRELQTMLDLMWSHEWDATDAGADVIS